jgi:hypothetical protein
MAIYGFMNHGRALRFFWLRLKERLMMRKFEAMRQVVESREFSRGRSFLAFEI